MCVNKLSACLYLRVSEVLDSSQKGISGLSLIDRGLMRMRVNGFPSGICGYAYAQVARCGLFFRSELSLNALSGLQRLLLDKHEG